MKFIFDRIVSIVGKNRTRRYPGKSKVKNIYDKLASLTLSQTTNFRLFQLKQFADDNFKFVENGIQLSK